MIIHYMCETCGKPGKRSYAQGKVPSHFFCSRECQNEWQKTREDIVLKNKDPEFRKKVSAGLKRRHELLGNDYHSKETREKIGAATVEHWNSYSDETRNHMIQVLNANAQKMRTYGPYDMDWKRLSRSVLKNNFCHRCGSRKHLALHHIIPVSQGGDRSPQNLVPLCCGCHALVERQEKIIYEIIPDWNIIQSLVRERLHCI